MPFHVENGCDVYARLAGDPPILLTIAPHTCNMGKHLTIPNLFATVSLKRLAHRSPVSPIPLVIDGPIYGDTIFAAHPESDATNPAPTADGDVDGDVDIDDTNITSNEGAQEQQRPARGLSLLDEDDQLAMHLDEQALDSLEEAGEDMVAAHRDETNEDSDDDEQHKGKAARARGEDEAENEEEVAEEEARARAEIVAARSEAGEQVDVNLSPATKLEALVKEFGPSEVHMEGEQPERFIADVPAVLLRTVLIKGSLALTNHRLCFLAFLPCATDAPNTLQARERAPNEPPSTEVSPIIKSGPATFHRPGRLRHKRKAWFELRKDSFSYYPSSEKLYQPIGSIRLSGIEELSPHDWKKPRFFPFKVKGRVCSLEFKTEEA